MKAIKKIQSTHETNMDSRFSTPASKFTFTLKNYKAVICVRKRHLSRKQ